VADSQCWAVGWASGATIDASSYETHTLVEQETGGGWSIVSSSNPPGSTADSGLTTVACVSARDCWAIGSESDPTPGPTQTLDEQDTGGGWTIVSSPNPSGSTLPLLVGATCVADSQCWAVASSTDASGNVHTLIEQGP
jgi:hypothetical protein